MLLFLFKICFYLFWTLTISILEQSLYNPAIKLVSIDSLLKGQCEYPDNSYGYGTPGFRFQGLLEDEC